MRIGVEKRKCYWHFSLVQSQLSCIVTYIDMEVVKDDQLEGKIKNIKTSN